ncbi:MAG: class I SAM-dependent methyltransferase [Candidatus Thorarchaeota archaeon]
MSYITINMPDWDDIFTEQGRVFTEPHSDMQRLTKVFQDNNVKRILDLGCGTGRHLVYLSKLGFDMYGLDASPRALNLAGDWLQEEGLNADLRMHRMEHTFPFDDGFFDAVISVQVIHHNTMQNIVITVTEIERILRDEGMTFITFPVLQDKPAPGKEDWGLEPIEENTYLPTKGPESGIPHHYLTKEEIPRVFRAFNILELYLDDTGHRCILGVKK